MRKANNILIQINDADIPEDGHFVVPEELTSIGSSAIAHCTRLTSITLPEGLTSIGALAFGHCTNLTSFTWPEGLTSINEYTFSRCTNLRSITLPEGLTSIGDGAFESCTNLRSITLPKGLTSIGSNAYRGCTGLTSITLPEGLTSIGDYAFAGCANLDTILIDTNDKNEFKRIMALLPDNLQDKIKRNIKDFRNAVSTLGQAARDNNSFFISEDIMKNNILADLAKQYGVPPFVINEIDEKFKHPSERQAANNNFTGPKT